MLGGLNQQIPEIERGAYKRLQAIFHSLVSLSARDGIFNRDIGSVRDSFKSKDNKLDSDERSIENMSFNYDTRLICSLDALLIPETFFCVRYK
jgi:hypothetical protein